MPIKGMSPKQVMHNEMHEFKHGQLHSGSKHGPKVSNRKQAIAIGLSEARKAPGGHKMYPGSGGPDPTNHEPMAVQRAHEQGAYAGQPEVHLGRSVAAADIALPHAAHGAQKDSGFSKGLPKQAQAPDRPPPKHGAYPSPAKPHERHGWGHTPAQCHGHLRMSGNPRSHQIGKR